MTSFLRWTLSVEGFLFPSKIQSKSIGYKYDRGKSVCMVNPEKYARKSLVYKTTRNRFADFFACGAVNNDASAAK